MPLHLPYQNMRKMEINNQIIDWNSPDVLLQIVTNIQNPLTSIIKANNDLGHKEKNEISQIDAAHIIFSNSLEISNLIEEVKTAIKLKSVQISSREQPVIFKIYDVNPNVKSLCKEEIISTKISKSDQHWLLNFEEEVFKHIKSNQLNLYDLSFCMAISERQLHRKIKNLLHLTPNKYIRILKLHKAKELIDQYIYDTVSEVSYAVGYYDTHYFSKLFYQQYHRTPNEFLSAKR